ncbi:MAG TPA: FBP domain-containing protein [Candidatus Saccharimonadales bacterium]|nr:FBP domain-containing protein [Candidatus Saccharimonadales bacterium]
MHKITREEFVERVASARIKPRLRKTLRFVPEEVTEWDSRDFLAVTDKSGNEGVLLYQDTTIPFTLSPRVARTGGRVAAIICDICATWRRGPESAVLTLPKGDNRTVSYLVCADLNCSLHVRGMTDAGILSRSQIHEDITPDRRQERLRERMRDIVA